MRIDAHAHLSDPKLDNHLDQLVAELKALGLAHVVLGGVATEEWGRQELLDQKYPGFVTPVFGIHPWTVRDAESPVLETMFKTLAAKAPASKAIGEVGVDFHQDNSPLQKNKQSLWCSRQLDLAVELEKPVVLHVVKGHDVMQGILKTHKVRSGLVHAFRGSAQIGRFYLDQGLILSLGKRSFQGLSNNDFRWLPLDGFVIESDAPGSRWETTSGPAVAKEWIESLDEVAQFLANVFNKKTDEVWHLAGQNLKRMFG